MQEGKSGSDSGKRETFLRVRLAPLPAVKEEKVMGEMMWALVKEKVGRRSLDETSTGTDGGKK